MASKVSNSTEPRHIPAAISSDDDATSSSGTSSSDSESESEESSEENAESVHHERETTTASDTMSVPSIPRRQKPKIQPVQERSDLLARLSTFLPKIRDANESLNKEIAAGRAQDVILDSVNEADGNDYIEMVS